MANKPQQKVSLWKLFLTFFKVGAFTFGGGYAMIAILEEELVSKKKWITSDDILDMLVIAESTPGVIAVNTATSVGFRLRGILGGIVATLGVVLPSFFIIFGLSFAICAFRENTWYKAAFTGIQACVTVLIVNAFLKMSKHLNKDAFSITLLLAAFAVATFTRFNVIFIILIGGVLGLAYTYVYDAITKKRTAEKGLLDGETVAEKAESEAVVIGEKIEEQQPEETTETLETKGDDQ